MSFENSIDEASKDMGSSDFFKFKEGDNKLRIVSEPILKLSRFGFGICYEGAPYCTDEALDKTWELLKEKSSDKGEDPEKVTRPSLGKKWSCWAFERADGNMVILDLPFAVAHQIRELKGDEDSGFDEWPMPFDVNVKATNAGNKKVKYVVVASRTDTPLTDEELHEIEAQTPMNQLLDKMKEKQRERDGSDVAYDNE